MELCWTRRPGYAGPTSLEYQEIEAWCRLTQRKLEQWELRVLLDMDIAYLQALRAKEEAEKKPEERVSIFSEEPVIDRPLTPLLFDALFANDNRGR